LAKSVVAITGASSGIGEVFARKLAPEHDLLLIARRKERLDQLRNELTSQYGCQVDTLIADLSVEAEMEAAAERIGGEQRLALLVNNAGFGSRGLFWEASLEVAEKMHRLHVMATIRLTHAALRNLVSRDCGGIINVASVAAFVRTPGSTCYGATKSWMTAFTEGIYLELRGVQSSVIVQALCPGFTYSEFHDKMAADRTRLAGSAFWMTAEEVVDASLEGLRRGRLFVVPGWRYRILASFISKVPTPLRLMIESRVGRRRQPQLGPGSASGKQLENGR
jgi:short-subunit dehydrogenase